MINQSLILILYWWFLLFSIGFIFLPLTFRLFPKFLDQGYLLSKTIGILVVSYLVWLLGSLKIFPFEISTIWLVMFLSLIGNFVFRKGVKKFLLSHWKLLFWEEALFLICLVFWSFIRGFQPDIQGLEKFMDFGFVNSILRSSWFPPADMWLAGKTINYYYFGHLIAAVLTKLSQIDSAIAYNLMIASLFALVFSNSYSFGANIIASITRKKKSIYGLGFLSTFLVSLGGNLHLFYWWLKNKNFAGYWYPDATRFIVEKFGAADNTIHEFPIYSFVVADLHGHIINLPGVILLLCLVISYYQTKKMNLVLATSFSFLLGIFYMTNTWDFAIYGLVLGLAVFMANRPDIKKISRSVFPTLQIMIPIALASLIFSLPFHLHFKNISDGIGIADFHSPLKLLLVLWGLPLSITIIFIFAAVSAKKKIIFEEKLVLSLIIISWFLIIFPELFYFKDIYIHSYQRANTMFKLTYQAFVMFGLVTPYVLLKAKKMLLLPIVFLLFFVFTYSGFAIRSYYGLKTYRGLYGLEYLKESYPDDFEAVSWLRKNIDGQPVIVEAVGESYTDFARISANTGLPTILGWRVHEWLWRGSFDEAGKRTEEVKKIYEAKSIEEIQSLLIRYRVDYIFIGDLERKQYSNLEQQKFEKIGKLVFSSNQTKIYQIIP